MNILLKFKYWFLGALTVILLGGGIATAAGLLPPIVRKGDLIYGLNNNQYQRLATGTQGSVLWVTSGGIPGWTATSTLGFIASGGSGATTTITSNVQIDGPDFTFASDTPMTGLNLNITGSGSTITFSPQLQSGYNIPLTASTTEWSNKLSTTTAAATYEPILTKGNLTATSPLQFDATRQVIGGAAALSVASGFTIPSTTLLSNLSGFYDTPSTRITAGNQLSWSINTLNVSADPSFDSLTLGSTVLVSDGTTNVIDGNVQFLNGSALQIEGQSGGTFEFNDNGFNTSWIALGSSATSTLSLTNNDSNVATFNFASLDNNYTYTFPNQTGTFGLVQGNQTWTGTNTFSNQTTLASTTATFLTVSGSVGIGTTTPAQALVVQGNEAHLINAVGTSGQFVLGTIAVGTDWAFRNVATSRDLGIVRFSNGSAVDTPLTIRKSNGFLGVGSSTPNSRLTVTGVSGSATNVFEVTSSTHVSTFKVHASGSTTIANLAVADCDVKANTLGSLYCGTDATGSASGNAAWTIGPSLIHNATATDSVLIGTTTPTTSSLFVQGSGTKSAFTVASSNGQTLLSFNKFNEGVFTSSVVSDGGYVLASGTNPFLDIYESDSAKFGGLQMSGGNLRVYTDGDEIVFQDPIDVTPGITSALIPTDHDAYDLGSAAFAWAGLFLGPDELICFAESCSIGDKVGSNDLLFFPVGSGAAPESNVILQSSAKLGINTNTPTALLHIQGIAPTTTPLTISSSTGSTMFSIGHNASLTVASLTASACDVKSTTGGQLYCGTDATGEGGGITSLNGLTADPQSFAIATSGGLSLLIDSVTDTHTFTLAPYDGYTIPTTTLLNNLSGFYTTPSTRITAGSYLSWSSNTLNGSSSPYFISLNASASSTLASTSIVGVLNVTGNIVGGNLSGTNTGDVTLAGTPDYITISGQVITRGTIDISDDTNLTAGDALTITGDDIDFDGGASPAGDLGGTWADPSVTDDSHAHTGTTLSGIDISSDTNLTGGVGLTLTGDDMFCDTGNGGTFGCLPAADWVTFNNKLGGTGTNGFAVRYTNASTTAVGKLIDNGTVLGMNATSSTIGFNIQGTAGSNDIFNLASSTGTSILQVTAQSEVLVASTAKLRIPTMTATGTLTTLGQIAVLNHANGFNGFVFRDSSAERYLTDVKLLPFSVFENATTSEDLMIWSPYATSTIVSVECNNKKPNDRMSLNLVWDASVQTATSSASGKLFTNIQTCTATTTPTVYPAAQSFNNTIVYPNQTVRFVTGNVASSTQFMLNIYYREHP